MGFFEAMRTAGLKVNPGWDVSRFMVATFQLYGDPLLRKKYNNISPEWEKKI